MQLVLAKLLSASAAALIFIAVNRAACARTSAKARFVLGFALALCFLIPYRPTLLRVELPVGETQAAYPEDVQGQAPSLPSEPQEPGEEDRTQQTKIEKRFFTATVCAIYALGACITLFCILYRYCRAVKLLRRYGIASSERQAEIFASLCEKHGLKKAPELLVCSSVGSSVTFGFFRETVIIADKFREEDFALILGHELTHCKRKDSFFKAVLSLLCSLYWFNPIIHAFIGEMNDLCEQSCDETLLKNSGTEEKQRYCRLLLQTALSNSAERKLLLSAFKGGKKIMKERITNILGQKSKVVTAVAIATVIFVTVLTSAIYVTTPPENIKVAYFEEPAQVMGSIAKEDVINNYYNIKYEYSVNSDEIKISGTVKGKDFNVTAKMKSGYFKETKLYYDGKDEKGNFDVMHLDIQFAQYTEIPVPEGKTSPTGNWNHYFSGFFENYAKENPKYKNAILLYMNPIDTDDLVIIEIFTENNFVSDYYAKNEVTETEFASKSNHWFFDWYAKYGLLDEAEK